MSPGIIRSESTDKLIREAEDASSKNMAFDDRK